MSLLKNFALFFIWMVIILYLSFTPLTNWPQETILQKLYVDKLGAYNDVGILLPCHQATKPATAIGNRAAKICAVMCHQEFNLHWRCAENLNGWYGGKRYGCLPGYYISGAVRGKAAGLKVFEVNK